MAATSFGKTVQNGDHEKRLAKQEKSTKHLGLFLAITAFSSLLTAAAEVFRVIRWIKGLP